MIKLGVMRSGVAGVLQRSWASHRLCAASGGAYHMSKLVSTETKSLISPSATRSLQKWCFWETPSKPSPVASGAIRSVSIYPGEAFQKPRFYSKGKGSAKGSGKVDVKRAYDQHCVVPDVIDCAPEDVIKICFNSGTSAALGNKLTPTNVKDEPTIFEWKAKPDCFYTIIKLDPDAPCREAPSMRHWLHWMIVNVRGCDICSGRVIAEYVGAGPPQDSGHHRYVYLVYLQKCELDFKAKAISNRTMAGRPKFDLNKFVAEHDLDEPVAGNFFLAEYDDYVPILYHQLGANQKDKK